MISITSKTICTWTGALTPIALLSSVGGIYFAWHTEILQINLTNPTTLIVAGTLCVSFTSSIIFTILARSAQGPMQNLAEAAQTISTKKSITNIPYADQKDGPGLIAKALKGYQDSFAEIEKQKGKVKEQKEKVAAQYRKEVEIMGNVFDKAVHTVVENLASSVTSLNSTAHNVQKHSEESGTKLSDLVERIDMASHNVQTVASAATELSASIDEIGNQVERSRTITDEAVQESNRANDTAEGLKIAANKIGGVLNVINDITERINLLALNATIEAARAGDAGKGFAVVAGEVKNLAKQTSAATQQIEEQINTIQSTANDTVNVIQKISTTIEEINGISSSIAAAVEEQGMATQEIARNVQQTAEITSIISSGALHVREAANDTRAYATGMMTDSEELTLQAESLRGQIKRFLDDIRNS